MCSVFLYPNNNIYSTTTGIFFSEWENRKNFKILAEILTKNSNKLRKKNVLISTTFAATSITILKLFQFSHHL